MPAPARPPPPIEVEPSPPTVAGSTSPSPAACLEKLDAARAALSHSHPGAGADEILEAALDLLLEPNGMAEPSAPRNLGANAPLPTFPHK